MITLSELMWTSTSDPIQPMLIAASREANEFSGVFVFFQAPLWAITLFFLKSLSNVGSILVPGFDADLFSGNCANTPAQFIINAIIITTAGNFIFMNF